MFVEGGEFFLPSFFDHFWGMLSTEGIGAEWGEFHRIAPPEQSTGGELPREEKK